MCFTSNSAQNNASGGYYLQFSKNGFNNRNGYAQSQDYNRMDNTQLLLLIDGDVIKVDEIFNSVSMFGVQVRSSEISTFWHFLYLVDNSNTFSL